MQPFNCNPVFNPINTSFNSPPLFPTVEYEGLIRSSNTIFSTMVCPECGERLVFERVDVSSCFTAYCPTRNHYSTDITFDEMCGILNHNGLNKLVTPYNFKSVETSKETAQSVDDIPPPDGFKIEPSGD